MNESSSSTPPSSKQSKVLHVRNLPTRVSEDELRAIAQPFGAVARILVLHNKLQAFVQMETIEQSSHMIEALNANQALIRGQRVYFQFSNRKEIELPSTQQTVSRDAKPQLGSGRSPPNSILIVSIRNTNLRGPTLENLHYIFHQYGSVLKIVTFMKSGIFKALVQMGSVEEGVLALSNLDNRDLYEDNCCNLRIGFSNLTDLTVKNNGPSSWDFTLHDYHQLPFQAFPNTQQHSSTPGSGYIIPPPSRQQLMLPPSRQQPSLLHYPPQPYDSKSIHGQDVNSPHAHAPMLYQDISQAGPCVLLVSNLSDEPGHTTPDILFTLFGVYGNVVRVKILYSKRDTALIQFTTPRQAQQALFHLNRLSLHGKELAVSFSKHIRSVSIPRDTSTDKVVLTKDYTRSPIHRFKFRDSRNARNIHPPSRVLHVSNINDDGTEQQLRTLFGTECKSPPVVQFFSVNRRMAYVCMPSLHEATLALIRLHNAKLGSRHLRVSFSGKNPSDVHPSDVHPPSDSSDELCQPSLDDVTTTQVYPSSPASAEDYNNSAPATSDE